MFLFSYLFTRVVYVCDSVCLAGYDVDVQYSNWRGGSQVAPGYGNCVLVTQNNEWQQYDCISRQRYVCQS